MSRAARTFISGGASREGRCVLRELCEVDGSGAVTDQHLIRWQRLRRVHGMNAQHLNVGHAVDNAAPGPNVETVTPSLGPTASRPSAEPLRVAVGRPGEKLGGPAPSAILASSVRRTLTDSARRQRFEMSEGVPESAQLSVDRLDIGLPASRKPPVCRSPHPRRRRVVNLNRWSGIISPAPLGVSSECCEEPDLRLA